MEILFEKGKTNLVSKTFESPAQLTLFNATPMSYTENNGVVTAMECGDYITFERVIFDTNYSVDCKGINENGVMASAPLTECDGCEIRLDANCNTLTLEQKGIYRAIYHGKFRENIILIKD